MRQHYFVCVVNTKMPGKSLKTTWKVLFMLSLVLMTTQVAVATNVETQTPDSGNISTASRNPEVQCPGQYIDSLAICPQALACETDADCFAHHICCDNICGSRTCFLPWHMQDNAAGTECDNVACNGQGRYCTSVDGEPTCQCIDKCGPPTNSDDFVCANDGLTYLTKCFMDMKACQSGTTITPAKCTSVPTPNTNLMTSSDDINIDPDEMSAPLVLSIPDMKHVDERETVIFNCDVTGHPKPAIFWQNKEDAIFMWPGHQKGRVRVSAVTGNLRITAVQTEDSGDYTCHAANQRGVASVTFRLKVKSPKSGIPSRGGRSSTVDCLTLPSEQATRCSAEENQRKIKKLWVYNRDRKACSRAYFRDCSAITNKFSSWSECANACMDICKLPFMKGSCRRFVQRIYYDWESGQCLPFAFSGCEGNKNNFDDVYACRAVCPSTPRSDSTHDGVYPPTQPKLPARRLPACPRCTMQEVQAVCRSEFAVVGFVKHALLDPPKGSISGGHDRFIQLKLTQVMQDVSPTLGLLQLNLENSEQATIEIGIVVDDDCPCPDVKTILSGKSSNRGMRSHGNSMRSRRIAMRGHNMKMIIVGRSENGVLILDSSGFVAPYSTKTFKRIRSALGPGICQALRMMESQFS